MRACVLTQKSEEAPASSASLLATPMYTIVHPIHMYWQHHFPTHWRSNVDQENVWALVIVQIDNLNRLNSHTQKKEWIYNLKQLNIRICHGAHEHYNLHHFDWQETQLQAYMHAYQNIGPSASTSYILTISLLHFSVPFCFCMCINVTIWNTVCHKTCNRQMSARVVCVTWIRVRLVPRFSPVNPLLSGESLGTR